MKQSPKVVTVIKKVSPEDKIYDVFSRKEAEIFRDALP